MFAEHDSFFSPLASYMQKLSSSNATNLPSLCDEEIAGEADEPPDEFLNGCHGPTSYSDGEFSKCFFQPLPPKESLLTRALLTSPHLAPVDRIPQSSGGGRGMSTSSTWSNASTAELTSDSVTNPSRCNTPSPPPPLYLSTISRELHSEQKNVYATPHVQPTFPKREIPERKTSHITFSCGPGQLSNRPSEDCENKKLTLAVAPEASDAFKRIEQRPNEPPRQKSGLALTFVCSQPTKIHDLLNRPVKSLTLDRPESEVLVKGAGRDSSSGQNVCTTLSKNIIPEPRCIYDSESAGDSWTNQPIDKSRLLRVDDVLRKERDIRKLSEEVEREALQEEGEEDEDDGEEDLSVESGDQDIDQDEDEEDEDEDDDEDDDAIQSGNETDNEEGFASGDESDDDGFFGIHPPMVPHIPIRRSSYDPHASCTPLSYSNGAMLPRRIRSPTPQLPDSTDFVCGTFDEDQPLEQAYLSCLEERKRIKHKTTPQDIDPSFPDSDPEDSENERKIQHEKVKMNMDGSLSDARLTGRAAKAEARSPRGRVHSPAPVRRAVVGHSPGPTRRAGNPVRSRHASPAPPTRRRAPSPAPTRAGRRMHFLTDRNIVRTRSLPRYPGCSTRRTGKSSRGPSAATSPQRHATRPVVIRRSAMDIVKGLEKRRERRKARLGRVKEKGASWKAGEGVEKMRLLGLEICGKGKPRQGIWMMSA